MGDYPIQPIHIEDVARIAVNQGESSENMIIDVAGPETFSYKQYVTLISESLGLKRLIIPLPPIMGWAVGKIVGLVMRDRVITRAEIKGLMKGLMATKEKPLGTIKFSDWISSNGSKLGENYHNDIKERIYSVPGES
jgi:NADH dehydrogenase